MFVCVDQGKPGEATPESKSLQYGVVDAKDYVPGTEVTLVNICLSW